jgi:hypothetical protein
MHPLQNSCKLTAGNCEPGRGQHEEDIRKAALVEARETFFRGRGGVRYFATLRLISPAISTGSASSAR